MNNTASAIQPAYVDPRPLRVLIHRTGSLGDTLVAIPALRLIAASFPNAERILLNNHPVTAAAAPAASVIEGLGLVQRTVSYASPGAFAAARGIYGLVRQLRPQVVVSLSSRQDAVAALRDRMLFHAAGVLRVIGLGLRARALRVLQGSLYEREAQRLARTVATLGRIDWEQPAAWHYLLPPVDYDEVERLVPGWDWQQKYLCVALGTKAASNDWGQQRWDEAIDQLAANGVRERLVCIGSQEDAARSQQLIERWPVGGINLCGRLSLRQTAAVLSRARLMLGHDSGPMHLAAAVGTRTVTVFSRRNPIGKWFPLGGGHIQLYSDVPCAGCGLSVCLAHANRCTRQVAAAELASQAMIHLQAG